MNEGCIERGDWSVTMATQAAAAAGVDDPDRDEGEAGKQKLLSQALMCTGILVACVKIQIGLGGKGCQGFRYQAIIRSTELS